MGTLYYGGSSTAIRIQDLALAHLKAVISAKLRRGESLTVSWRHPSGQADGRSTVWINPSMPIRFVFDEPETPALSRHQLEELSNASHSAGGVVLATEDMLV